LLVKLQLASLPEELEDKEKIGYYRWVYEEANMIISKLQLLHREKIYRHYTIKEIDIMRIEALSGLISGLIQKMKENFNENRQKIFTLADGKISYPKKNILMMM
jgi:hypothetical protein